MSPAIVHVNPNREPILWLGEDAHEIHLWLDGSLTAESSSDKSVRIALLRGARMAGEGTVTGERFDFEAIPAILGAALRQNVSVVYHPEDRPCEFKPLAGKL